LYLKNVGPLFDTFLSLILASGIPDDLSCQPGSEGHGLGRNACALGISNIDLQLFFDLAWGVLRQADFWLTANSPSIRNAYYQ
jgi:hypothetical protein